ncbi:hypothetical protein niasHT_034548 [Heterodera trifolii]|uniref:Uncharacterized protein n=1 Tax=Heterodera trifolii TaxID=157864 RepID=A0ABD2I593_9BILA
MGSCPFKCGSEWNGFKVLLDRKVCCVTAPLDPVVIDEQRKKCKLNGKHFEPVFASILPESNNFDTFFSCISLSLYNSNSEENCDALRALYVKTLRTMLEDPEKAGINMTHFKTKDNFLKHLSVWLLAPKNTKTFDDHMLEITQKRLACPQYSIVMANALKRPIIWLRPADLARESKIISEEDAKRFMPQWDDDSRPRHCAYYYPEGEVVV